jgi:hypothetical protein
MAQQTQLLAALVDGANRCQGGQQNDFQRKLEGFLKLRPPTSDGTDPDLLVADDWLKEVEKKLDLTTFTDDECVGAATHQLTGAARTWWDSFSDSHEDPINISWDEFAEAFTEYHIPKGIMEAKAEEFCNIKMGKDRVTEYTTCFTNLLRYAPSYVVNSEKENLYYYRKGLNPHIKLKFGSIKSSTLCALVDCCIQIEKDYTEAGEEYRERKCKPEAMIARGSVEMHHPGNALATTGMTTLDQVGVVEATPPNTPALLRIIMLGIVMLRTVSTVPAQRMNAQHRTALHQALETGRHPRQPL